MTASSATVAVRTAPRFRIDPRYLQAGLATTILVVGQALYGTIGGFDRLAVALACAVGADVILSRLFKGKWPNWASTYISGLSIVILTKPVPELWPFALGSLLSITSKYVITYRHRHLFNPTNFGLCVMLLVASDRVALLSTQWGNSVSALALIWGWGLFVVWRARVMHLTLTYFAAFTALSWVRCQMTGNTFASEWAPITGPMQTLFMFFMITDPATVMSRIPHRVLVVLLIALLECFFRMQNHLRIPGLDFVLWAPSMFALFFLGAPAKWIDLRFFAGATPAPRVAPR